MQIRFVVLFLLSLLLLFSLPALYSLSQDKRFYGHFINQPAHPFRINDVNGKPHSLEQHLGQFVFVYFGYLHCDQVCHNQVGVMFNIDRQASQKNIEFLFISMDPERDSPERLATYFNQFGSNFNALRPENTAQIQSIARHYHASFFKEPSIRNPGQYDINHPGTLFLIDPEGQLALIYPNMHLRYDFILKDLEQLEKRQTHDVNS
jgi:protein SCO1/2